MPRQGLHEVQHAERARRLGGHERLGGDLGRPGCQDVQAPEMDDAGERRLDLRNLRDQPCHVLGLSPVNGLQERKARA